MIRLAISVEGQTEERFVKTSLEPHLLKYGVSIVPIIVATSRSASGVKAKGGGINLSRVAAELRRLLRNFDYVTTLYDYYGFDVYGQKPDVDALETEIGDRLESPQNLIAYVQRHEFEALLLSDAQVAGQYFQSSSIEREIIRTVRLHGTPEDVNDKPQTAPSKRLELWTETHAPVAFRYNPATKVRHGPPLAQAITLSTIANACPRFGAWLRKLENLAQS